MFAGTAARLAWACVAAFVFLVPPAAAADGGFRPPSIPHGRELEALASEDVQHVIRHTARFNWHGELLRALLGQPGVKSTVFQAFLR